MPLLASNTADQLQLRFVCSVWCVALYAGEAAAAFDNIPADAPSVVAPLQLQREEQPASATILKGLLDEMETQAEGKCPTAGSEAAWSSAMCRVLCALSKLRHDGADAPTSPSTKSRYQHDVLQTLKSVMQESTLP